MENNDINNNINDIENLLNYNSNKMYQLNSNSNSNTNSYVKFKIYSNSYLKKVNILKLLVVKYVKMLIRLL